MRGGSFPFVSFCDGGAGGVGFEKCVGGWGGIKEGVDEYLCFVFMHVRVILEE